ncbi:hypothetical protein RIF29_27192 [Crotalaria pallida]|uniref:Uncharacterized protein n=1 Tax=Crotalaria pallida TaxID=3830 RepID=A0AAN9EPK5_CROPI
MLLVPTHKSQHASSRLSPFSLSKTQNFELTSYSLFIIISGSSYASISNQLLIFVLLLGIFFFCFIFLF